MPKPAKSAAPVTKLGKLEAAIIKTMGQDVVDTILESSPDELKNRLARLASEENDIDKELSENEEIQEMKETLKNLEAPFKESLKGNKLQRNYVALQLADKGKA